MPTLPNTYLQIFDGQPRNFNSPEAPDLIIINVGANDGNEPVDNNITNVLNNLLVITPPITKIAVIRPFDGAQENNLVMAVASCNSPRLHYIDTTGWWDKNSLRDAYDGIHPTAAANTRIANQLARDTAAIHS